MRRLLTLLLVFTLAFANGSAFAGAVCRHQSLADHLAARTSGDVRISGAALSEEAADQAASKKAALADAGAFVSVAHPARGPELAVPFAAVPSVDPFAGLVTPLLGRSPQPLLQPPSA
jgi:hypothetical protein